MVVSCVSAQLQSQVAVPLQQPEQVNFFIDGYVAQVEDIIITDSDVRELMIPMLPAVYQKFQGAELEREIQKLHQEARDDLIERALVQKAFAESGGQMPDQYVEDEIKRVIRERFNNDAAKFEQTLSDQKKTRQEYKDVLKQQIIYGVMYNEEVTRRARITPQQVRDEYDRRQMDYQIPEQVKFSVILLNKGTTAEDKAVKLKEAQDIRQRLLEGADFAETAKKVSEGSRAADGGAFPWMAPKDVRPELVETLNNLPAGEISDIVETEMELYIVRLDARQQASIKPFEDVRKEITSELLTAEKKRLRSRWMERLKEKYYVNIYQ
ncbi:MAG: peptidylprolyl isomerase [Kiritimatiellales bacterium]|nr:peptidylprolyl isomerase [Kiritimatiellales bacterium]